MTRNDTGHVQIPIMVLQDRLRDRWLATPGLEPTATVLDVLEDLQALGCERAGAMLERERRRGQP
jgi:hypothetical protein